MTSKRESPDHIAAKKIVFNSAANRNLEPRLEERIYVPGKEVDIRADLTILTSSMANRRCAIEFQRSSISAKEIERRTFQYLKAGLHVLWIMFLDKKKIADLTSSGLVKNTQTGWLIEKYPQRPSEKWLRTKLGQVWYFAPRKGYFLRATMKPFEINEKIHPDNTIARALYGETIKKDSKKWITLDLQGPFTFDQLQIVPTESYKLATLRPLASSSFKTP